MPLSRLPPRSNLFIVTPNAIALHSQTREKLLFECESPDGILNARPAKDNSCVLAVADSHLVVLYDSEHRGSRRYRLKSGDGEPRLLLFSPDSRTLFFTTTLSNSIQAYSVSTARLLPAFPPHPSPPNVLVISKNGDVLLSASTTPPTVHIQDLRLAGTAPTQIPAKDARSVVTCAVFLEEYDISGTHFRLFVLGFQDGTLALYRLALTPLSDASIVSRVHPLGPMAPNEPVKICSIKKLHKPAMGGIRAVEFIPGFRARVVSIGYDGKCRIADFENGGEVLRTWRVPGAPTCLSVASIPLYRAGWKNGHHILSSKNRAQEEEGMIHQGAETLIAVAVDPETVLIFNILGLLLHEVDVQAPIIALEWVGDMTAPSALPKRIVSSQPSVPEPQLPHQPLLDMLANEYDASIDDDSEQESGTVKRNEPPANRSAFPSPMPFQAFHNLFDIPPNVVKPLSRKQDDIPPIPERSTKRPRKKYPRPRIVTDTFENPVTPPETPVRSPLPGNPTESLAVPSMMVNASQQSEVRRVPELPLMSGALGHVKHSGSSEYSSDAEDYGGFRIKESENWFTPPTSHTAQSPPKAVRGPGSVSSPNRHFRFRATAPSASLVLPSTVVHPNHSQFKFPADPGDGGAACRYSPSTTQLSLDLICGQPGVQVSPIDERMQRIREFLSSMEDDDVELGDGKTEENPMRVDELSLREEIQALRREFVLLRETLLASRG